MKIFVDWFFDFIFVIIYISYMFYVLEVFFVFVIFTEVFFDFFSKSKLCELNIVFCFL